MIKNAKSNLECVKLCHHIKLINNNIHTHNDTYDDFRQSYENEKSKRYK